MATSDHSATPPRRHISQNTRLGLNLLMIAAGMLMLAYASVPLYDLFCRVTGFGGTTQQAITAPPESAILAREVEVSFNADIAPELPWEFKPLQKKVRVKIGEKKLIFYSARNTSTAPVTGIATFNVTPEKAGAYFNKIQCFCFENQTLQPGEEVTMPVSFFVDPAVANDKNMEDLQDITLSYTFFPAKK